MRKLFLLLFLLVFIGVSLYQVVHPVYSDELDDLNKKIGELQSALDSSKKATTPLKTQLSSLKTQLDGIITQVNAIDADIIVKKKNIDEGYKNLAHQQIILNKTIRDYYIKSYAFSPFLVFLSAKDATDVTRILAYGRRGTDADKAVITTAAITISDLETRKQKLEDEQVRLESVKTKLASQRADVEKVVKGAEDYQTTLSNQIASLSAKQQQLLAAKLGSLNIPQSAYTTQGGCTDDRNVDPGFAPRFAAFTYGVPNRIGLNQYGAKGRAEAGQNAETILAAYYNADLKKDYNTGINIHVTGTNEYGQSFDTNWDIETYVKHIYEMPTGWSMEALKAQAVAARSYALAATNNGASNICPSQSCQVVKQEENSDAWKAAVDATRGWVLVNGGNPIKAWFSSTHGGYVFSSGDIGWSGTAWTKRLVDTTSGSASSFDELASNAYDKASPWFYCDWGSRAQYNKTAWLKSDELADIVNVLMLAKKDGGTQNHLSQVDKPNPDGTDTWDANKVRQELSNRGGTPYSSVSSVSIDWDKGTGKTNSVRISGDAGENSFDGGEFKTYFNLRAPANINIVGPLFNFEKR